MKFSLEKRSITLAEVDDAKALLDEYKGYCKDNDMLETLIRAAIKANMDEILPGYYGSMDTVYNVSECTITKNRDRLTAWIKCVVKVNNCTIVEMEFDGIDAMSWCEGETVSAYIKVYRRQD